MSLKPVMRYAGSTVVTRAGKQFSLVESGFLRNGGEGEVYRVDDEHAVKVYLDQPVQSQYRSKLDTLCVLRAKGKLPESAVAPIDLVRFLHQPAGHAAGFIMKFLPDAKEIDRCGARWNSSVTSTDEPALDLTIANLIYDVSEAIAHLHRIEGSPIYMADLNPGNILISGRRPYLIDFDSCFLRGYPADSKKLEYVDPLLRGSDAKNQGPYQFEPRNDWWPLAVIAFKLFIGVSPWTGEHPSYTSEVTRSYHNLAVYFDSEVKPPDATFTRPERWLLDRPKIREYFKGIFSKDIAKRMPMVNALKEYFPRQQIVHTSRMATLLAGIAAKSASIDERIRELGEKWEKEVCGLSLGSRQKTFIGQLLRKMQDMAIKKMSREEARVALADAMMLT